MVTAWAPHVLRALKHNQSQFSTANIALDESVAVRKSSLGSLAGVALNLAPVSSELPPPTPTPLGEAHRQHVGSPAFFGLAAPLAGDVQTEIAEAAAGLPLTLLEVGYLGVAVLVALDVLDHA
eukprot:6491649-Amphidinium_carterae.1